MLNATGILPSLVRDIETISAIDIAVLLTAGNIAPDWLKYVRFVKQLQLLISVSIEIRQCTQLG